MGSPFRTQRPQRSLNFVILAIAITMPSLSFALWTGPNEVITATWGSAAGQFDIYRGESNDFFPKVFGVDKDGIIVIPDEGNKRIGIYNPNGIIRNTIYKPTSLPDLDSSDGWPPNFSLYPGGNSFIVYCNYQKTSKGEGPINICFLDYSGALLSRTDLSQVFPFEAGFILLKNNIYTFYSPTGQLIKTSTTRPLELGVASEQSLGNGHYKVTVKYFDKVWSLVGEGVLPKYTRDTNGNLYGYGEMQAIRYTGCGRELAILTMPTNSIQKISRGPAIEPKIKVIEEYGSPVIAPNGDVYTWKRTPDNYSILKWTWVDDPNVQTGPDAPLNLTVKPSINGLYLTWSASPNDPGCVTGYEIYRATAAGGVGSTVATMNAGVVKYNDTSAAAGTTYYYKIRAVSESDYSPYTSEVSGKR